MTILTAIVWASSASAQDGIDAHGFVAAPSDNELLDPVAVWRAEPGKPGYVGVSGLVEYASRPLVLYLPATGTDRPLLDNVVALNLGASVGFHERISAALTVPLVLTSRGGDGTAGPTLADARLAVPVALVYADGDDPTGFHLSIVPFADLPIGDVPRYLGSGGLAGGAIVAARYGGATWDVDGNLGVQATPAIRELVNLNGGAHLIVGAAGAVALTDFMAARVEVNVRPTLDVNEVAGTESPGEVLGSLRGRYESGLSWTLGGAGAITPGAGAAAFRAFVGVGYTRASAPPVKDTDLDGLVDELDACPTVPETVNGYDDADGCADALASVAIRVVDPKRRPIEGATLTIGDQSYVTDPDGRVVIADLVPKTQLPAGRAVAERFADQPFAPIAVEAGAAETTVMLLWTPATLTVTAYTVEGDARRPVDATVSFTSRALVAPIQLGSDGTEAIELPANTTYEVLVAAEGFLAETREVSPMPGEILAEDVALRPAKAVIRGSEIVILDKVRFDTAKATINPESFPLLDQIAEILATNPQITKVEVQGHTDDKGNDAYNLKLAQQRVDSVVAYLVARGVEGGRLTAVGYGESKPLVANDTEAHRAENRRVQFVITEQSPQTRDSGPPSR